jgi:hypothetical protein
MNEKLDIILQKLESIESAQKQHSDLLQQQGDMITQLIGIVASTNQKVTTIESDMTAIKGGQFHQERILETLALRSMDQEGEIRHLKSAK